MGGAFLQVLPIWFSVLIEPDAKERAEIQFRNAS